jgi:putative ABC transport system permease protein
MMVPLYPRKCPPAQRKFYYQEVLTRINNLPGVQVAATGTPLPLTGSWMKDSFGVVGRPSEPAEPPAEFHEVSVEYFRTMGIQLRAGRSFTEQDDEKAPPVAVINEAMARRHFAGEDPVGKHIQHEGSEAAIIGVVADVKRYGLGAEVQSEVYRSYPQAAEPLGLIMLVVRTAEDPLKRVSEVRQQIRAINADLPIESVLTMEQRLAESMAARRFQMLLFGAFAAVALTLAAVGVYGITSYSVSRRTHEIGIRVALGAQPRDVVLMLVGQGMLSAVVGVAVGLAAALALTRLMVGLLFNLTATDPDTFIVISLLLVTVAFLATYIPARRAARIEPIVALRHE